MNKDQGIMIQFWSFTGKGWLDNYSSMGIWGTEEDELTEKLF